MRVLSQTKLFPVCPFLSDIFYSRNLNDTYTDGALLGSPMALVGGMAGREGKTELRKATGFWIRLVGETGAGETQRGWNWFPLEMANVSGAGSTGARGGGSFGTETPPRDLFGTEGWETKRLSLLTVLWMVWGVLLRVKTGELEGDTVAAVVFGEGKKCFGRAKLNVCDEGAFTCLLGIVTAGEAVEFKALMLKGNSLGEEGDRFCSCCCSSRTWLWSCCSWLESLHKRRGERREICHYQPHRSENVETVYLQFYADSEHTTRVVRNELINSSWAVSLS